MATPLTEAMQPGMFVLSDASGPNPKSVVPLAKDQNHSSAAIVPRRATTNGMVDVVNEDGKTTRKVSAESLGLAARPVLIQRGADVDGPKAPIEVLNTNGTSAGHRQMDTLGTSRPRETTPPGDPVAPRADVQPAAPGFIPISQPTMGTGTMTTSVIPAVVKAAPTKKKVQIGGAGMGRMTVFCQEVIVSPSIVVLGYPQDGSTAIVEPPQAGLDAPVVITYEGAEYRCLSNEWSFEMGGLLCIVLIRIPA